MSETSLADLVGTVSQRRPAAMPAKFDDEPEYRAFTFGRVGARSQPRFEICKCDGYQLMLAYVDLKTVETMNAANGFVLGFLGFKVAIQGQNLLPCYRYLFTERIDAIVEASRALVLSTAATEPLVTAIKVEGSLPTKNLLSTAIPP